MAVVYLEVGMTCEGCASAIKKILGKLDGVIDVETDVVSKSVKITADGVTAEEMVKKLEKW
eukprot:CAMPEP_0184855688 /NCGR_PEP_ID=MMETSP0580-20130426/844_1 /TAXON_ID=1118495 /ORGANISM="Dactyliosolen fragilissimus" /LENGTH=60 /DNA_ID=CAMNT_0027350253 /DNA_START=35 /DNA_END=214 /DNA_ORIENTATION=+